MPSDPIIDLPDDRVLSAHKFVVESAHKIGAFMSDILTKVMERVSPMNAEFFSDPRIGTRGVALLEKLGAHIQFLATHYPAHMNATLARAGLYLTKHPDGTVTYDPPPTFTGPTYVSATIGEAFSLQVQASPQPVSFTANGLPDGLLIDPQTGLISGTPTVEGEHTVTVTALLANVSGLHTVQIYVNPAPAPEQPDEPV